MDKDLLWVGVTMILIGLGGIYAVFSGVAETFREGLQGPVAFMIFMGFVFFIGGLLRDGLPTIGPTALALILTGIIVSIATLLTFLFLLPPV
ncbi:hypothetical protein HRbin06_00863 [archaeon HR06]|nr:hypothetical protein HRbin06_00863 [archaeon HR06]